MEGAIAAGEGVSGGDTEQELQTGEDTGWEVGEESAPSLEPSGSVSEPSDEAVLIDTEIDAGMVEFFVEGEDGQINRIETLPKDKTEAPGEEINEAEIPPVELPDTEEEMVAGGSEPAGDELDEATTTAEIKTPPRQSRWRDPMKRRGPGQIFSSEQDASPSSGTIYNLILIILGVGALFTNFINLGSWRFDPVWASTLLILGIVGFFMQNLSGIFVASFFSFSFGFALFSRQKDVLEQNILEGVFHIAVIFAIGILFMVVYYLLMGRKRGLFVLQEGSGQSMLSLVFGVLALGTAWWAHITSPTIYSLRELPVFSEPLNSYIYYSGVPVPVIVQSCVAALAVAFGLSAMRVRNRLLLLATMGVTLGLIVLALQFAHLVFGEISFASPV
jgi:hypothetical protein